MKPEEEGVMGSFDSKHLRNLAIQFANTMKFPIFEKGCLGPLFKFTLQEDPALRLSDLNCLPIVSVWNSSGASSLQHKLAMHVGTSEFTFDVRNNCSPPSRLLTVCADVSGQRHTMGAPNINALRF
jgi:hypothetical protein